MRVILDTNVLLSALLKPDIPPYKLVDAWLNGRFDLVSSVAQVEEIVRVARYQRVRQYLAPAEISCLVNRVRARTLLVERLPKVDVSSDPGDNFLLAMAQAGSPRFQDSRQFIRAARRKRQAIGAGPVAFATAAISIADFVPSRNELNMRALKPPRATVSESKP